MLTGVNFIGLGVREETLVKQMGAGDDVALLAHKDAATPGATHLWCNR